MDSIRDWFNNGRSYKIGVALYNTYGDNELLKTALAQGYSDFRMNKLVEAMEELLEQNPKETQSHEVKPQPLHKTEEEPDPYKGDWKPLYKEMQFLFAKLTNEMSEEERGRIAFRILDLERTCKRFWNARDFERQYGYKMPVEDPKKDILADKNQLVNRRNTVRTYISRYKKLKLAEPENAAKHQSFIDKYRDELKELELKIKA